MSGATASTLIIVTEPEDWPFEVPEDVAVVSAKDYLTVPEYAERSGVRVINLCRTYRYQRAGYYVSLLALARGHRPMPALAAIQDIKSPTVLRIVSDDLYDLAQRELSEHNESEVVLRLHFGRDVHGRFKTLARALFGRLPIPLMRATFTRHDRRGEWTLTACSPCSPRLTPATEGPHLLESLRAFLMRRTKTYRRDVGRYDLAILADSAETEPPSDAEALRRFESAAQAEGFAVEFIDRNDYARIAEFDALFIRETTSVNHRTFRFAQRAAKEGLVVIDDPESILRCTNKVFLAEALRRHGVSTPATMIAHRKNLDAVMATIGLPCVLKQPDSSFSQGVVKVNDPAAFAEATRSLLRRSDLIVAQAFTPTDFDWRIGVLAREPLYACRYLMAARHWQIIRRSESSDAHEEGDVETVPLSAVPDRVLTAALAAASLMGDGLYGVDLKEVDGEPVVIEVNDNPSIDAGYEDAVLGDGLYLKIMADFRRRLDHQRRRKGNV